MSKRIEKLLKDYPELVQERDYLVHQLAHFKGVSTVDVIESMYTPRMDGERVQTSNLSDKTAQIALTYQERQERINRDWFEYLENRLRVVCEQIGIVESAICALPNQLSGVMWDMIVEGMTWAAIAEKFNTCRSNVGKLRKKAIIKMEIIYDKQIQEATKYLLE